MFERYTEKARRVIFFARYEASNYGSPWIESEHLLLGLFREDRGLAKWFPEYNQQRPHQSLEYATPEEWYRDPAAHGACRSGPTLRTRSEQADHDVADCLHSRRR